MAANPKLSEEDKKARRLQDMEARRAMFQAVRPSTDTGLSSTLDSRGCLYRRMRCLGWRQIQPSPNARRRLDLHKPILS